MKSILKIMVVSWALVMGLQLKGQDANKTLLQTEKMAKELGLNEKQKAELDRQLKANQADRKAKMEQMKALRAEMQRDAFVERQAKEEKLKSILTEEQLAKYEALKAERKTEAKFRGRKGGQDRNTKNVGRGNPEQRNQMIERRQKRLEEKGGEENH